MMNNILYPSFIRMVLPPQIIRIISYDITIIEIRFKTIKRCLHMFCFLSVSLSDNFVVMIINLLISLAKFRECSSNVLMNSKQFFSYYRSIKVIEIFFRFIWIIKLPFTFVLYQHFYTFSLHANSNLIKLTYLKVVKDSEIIFINIKCCFLFWYVLEIWLFWTLS